MIFRYLYGKRQLENCWKVYYITIILLSINHRHTNPQMLYMIFLCVLSIFLSLMYFIVYILVFFSLLSYINL